MYKVRLMKKRKESILVRIQSLEYKRQRSEYGILNSLINNKPIDPEDVKYFNLYSAKIDEYREELRELEKYLVSNKKIR